MDSEMIRIKRIKTSKRFATLLGSTILVLLVIAYLSPRNTFVSTYTIIKASPESVLMVLNKPENFNLWNPWYGQDTAVKYKTSKQASGEVNTIYWTSKNNADLTGNLKYEKSENPL